MKNKTIIFFILIIVIGFILGVYFVAKKQSEIKEKNEIQQERNEFDKERTYVAVIDKIEKNSVYVNEVEVETSSPRTGYFWFNAENIKILDRDNKEIKAEDLNVGDTVIITSNTSYINYMNPPIVYDIKIVKVVYESAK